MFYCYVLLLCLIACCDFLCCFGWFVCSLLTCLLLIFGCLFLVGDLLIECCFVLCGVFLYVLFYLDTCYCGKFVLIVVVFGVVDVLFDSLG